MSVLLLAIDTEDMAHDKEVKVIGIAAGFVVECLENGRGECTFTFGGEEAFPELELRGLLGWESDLEQCFIGRDFEALFQGGGGDVEGQIEVVVARAARALPSS